MSALGSETRPLSMVAPLTPAAVLVTNTPLPVRAESHAAWPSVLSGRLVPASVRVWPPVAPNCTPPGASTKGFWVAPWPPNR